MNVAQAGVIVGGAPGGEGETPAGRDRPAVPTLRLTPREWQSWAIMTCFVTFNPMIPRSVLTWKHQMLTATHATRASIDLTPIWSPRRSISTL
jgi:hypothetical protein